MPTVTEKGWAKLGPKFTFLKCPTITVIAVISLWRRRLIFPLKMWGFTVLVLCYHPVPPSILSLTPNTTCVPD